MTVSIREKDKLAGVRNVEDYRWRLTRKVLKRLEAGNHVVVIGGPRMGKTYLANRVACDEGKYRVFDGIKPAEVWDKLGTRQPTLMTTDIAFWEDSKRLGENVFRVPLTTIIPKHLQQYRGVSWGDCRGHPGLVCQEVEKSVNRRRLWRGWKK